jgi:predicted nucleic acid-binding Zn ribbon protein
MADQPANQPDLRNLRRQMHNRYCSRAWILGRDNPAVPVARVTESLARKLGVTDQVWVAQIQTAWPNLVGAPIAAHTRPGGFERGRLYIYVDNAVWLNELSRYNRPQMLKKLQARFPHIKELILRLDPDIGRGGA